MVFKGEFKNFNTVEEFRSPQAKKMLFDSMVARVGVDCALKGYRSLTRR